MLCQIGDDRVRVTFKKLNLEWTREKAFFETIAYGPVGGIWPTIISTAPSRSWFRQPVGTAMASGLWSRHSYGPARSRRPPRPTCPTELEWSTCFQLSCQDASDADNSRPTDRALPLCLVFHVDPCQGAGDDATTRAIREWWRQGPTRVIAPPTTRDAPLLTGRDRRDGDPCHPAGEG
jgi:hypothetical protein